MGHIVSAGTVRGRATRVRVEKGAGGEPSSPPTLHPSVLEKRGAATARGALGWYRPSVGVPRDVGCRRCIRVANLFSVQFSVLIFLRGGRPG